MDKLLPTRFQSMFKALNVTKEPKTWKIEECNSQIVVTLVWDSSLVSVSPQKSDVDENNDEIHVLNVSTGSESMNVAEEGQRNLGTKRESVEAEKRSESEDVIEILHIDTDDEKGPNLTRQSQGEVVDPQESIDDVIMLDEYGNPISDQPDVVEVSANDAQAQRNFNMMAAGDRIPRLKQPMYLQPYPEDEFYYGKRPKILKERPQPLSEEEMKWELKRYTLCLKSDMNRTLPLEHYVEVHRQRLIMLNNWFICNGTQDKNNHYSRKDSKKFKNDRGIRKIHHLMRQRPNFMRHIKMALTVEEIKHEIDTYKARLVKGYSVEPTGLPVDYYVGKFTLKLQRLNRWFEDKKTWKETYEKGVWWKAPALPFSRSNETPSSSQENKSTKPRTDSISEPLDRMVARSSEIDPSKDNKVEKVESPEIAQSEIPMININHEIWK